MTRNSSNVQRSISKFIHKYIGTMEKQLCVALIVVISIGCTVADTDYCAIGKKYCGSRTHVACNNNGVSALHELKHISSVMLTVWIILLCRHSRPPARIQISSHSPMHSNSKLRSFTTSTGTIWPLAK